MGEKFNVADFFAYVMFLTLLLDVNIQNDGKIQDGVESIFIFHPLFLKYFFINFFFVKIKLSWKICYLENSK
jgi:hypothetical protein